MALIACPECGNEISSEAKACPQCGKVTASYASKRYRTIFVVAMVLLFVVMAALVWNEQRLDKERQADNICSLLGDC